MKCNIGEVIGTSDLPPLVNLMMNSYGWKFIMRLLSPKQPHLGMYKYVYICMCILLRWHYLHPSNIPHI